MFKKLLLLVGPGLVVLGADGGGGECLAGVADGDSYGDSYAPDAGDAVFGERPAGEGECGNVFTKDIIGVGGVVIGYKVELAVGGDETALVGRLIRLRCEAGWSS